MAPLGPAYPCVGNCPKRSVWRKRSFGGVVNAVETSDRLIRAMGITDYFGIEGYEGALSSKEQGQKT